MFEKRVLNIFSILIGIFFLISGFGKMIDAKGFSELINQYGFGFFSILSPVIIIVEIIIGIFLVLLILPKQTSFLSFLLLIIFTASFAFAHFKNGINDCGCFGTIQHSNTPPYLSFIRNILFIIIALSIWIKYPKEKIKIAKWKKLILLIVVGISIFITGLTFEYAPANKKAKQKHPFQNQNIKNTELSNYLKTSVDSTYLFFCFSYDCPHCWNSIENLRQYRKSHAVDSVVTLVTGKEADRKFFNENFKADFSVKELPSKTIGKLVNAFPTAFFIEHDTIKVIVESVLPSHFTIKKMYNFPNSKK